jgi:hypothetical protein
MNLARQLLWIFAILCLAPLIVALAMYLLRGLVLVVKAAVMLTQIFRDLFVMYDSLVTAILSLIRKRCV